MDVVVSFVLTYHYEVIINTKDVRTVQSLIRENSLICCVVKHTFVVMPLF